MKTIVMEGKILALFLIGFFISSFFAGCAKKTGIKAGLEAGAAQKVYVPPGKWDKYYAFLSGGYSGQVEVYGLPSGRLIKVIPVFSVWPMDGYGYTQETKPLLRTTYGFISWDDAHHPEFSETNGIPNGKWLFINANNTPRIARIGLRTFSTKEIIQIPNAAGNHPSPFSTENSEYLTAGGRFSVPVPNQDVPISSYKKTFKGVISFVHVDPKTGRMSLAFQILMPPFDYDIAHCGKGPSKHWCFFTAYNTEEAHTLLEVGASQYDKDLTAAINWKKAASCAKAGKGMILHTPYYDDYVGKNLVAKSVVFNKESVLTPQSCPGMAYYIPIEKSPHGVDVTPSGKHIVYSGKLASQVSVVSFKKMISAIKNKDFSKTVYGKPALKYTDGIPVLKYNDVLKGIVKNICLGPLHTEFDGKGFAYTSCFISSEIVKWNLKTLKVVDQIPVYYAIGHLMIPGGDSAHPWGHYLLALDKISKDRYLPVGPEMDCRSAQLIDISGNRMRLLSDFPTLGEPHYAQACPASLLDKNALKYLPLKDNTNPWAAKTEADAKVVRKGDRVDVYMTAIRSHFVPDNIEGIRVGDTVYFHVTNIEQDFDIRHGFAIKGGPSAMFIAPGYTLTLKWKPERPGIYPFYCTDFCSALHQEMQGYVRVSPQGVKTNLCWGTGGKTNCKD